MICSWSSYTPELCLPVSLNPKRSSGRMWKWRGVRSGELSGPSVMKGWRASLWAGQGPLAMLMTPEFSVTAWITAVNECTDCKHTSAACLP